MNPDSDLARLPAVVREAARRVLAYLAETDPLPRTPVDAIMGFGMFDLSLPRFCAELHDRGLAPRLLFTGGIGAGTGDLGGAEADVWKAEARRTHPHIPDAAILTENRSTNTAENVEFTDAMLRERFPELAFGTGIKAAVVVASPSRLRRVRLTLRQRTPDLKAIRLLPNVDLAREHALYERQGVAYLPHLVGELDRLQSYAERGWIASESIPAEVLLDGQQLRSVR